MYPAGVLADDPAAAGAAFGFFLADGFAFVGGGAAAAAAVAAGTSCTCSLVTEPQHKHHTST